ncbi:MAG: hypothetical protein D6708_11230, partial [Candidatus Dadabacteria bacterium]
MGGTRAWAGGIALVLALGCGAAGTSEAGPETANPGPLVLRAQTIAAGGVMREVRVPDGMVLEFLAGGMDRPRF